MIIHTEAEDVRFIKSNPRMFPRVNLTGIGQLLQCCAIRSGEGTYPGMRRRSKLRPLDITLICRPKKRLLFIANSLEQQVLGLEEVDDGVWSICFCDVLLASVDDRDYVIRA